MQESCVFGQVDPCFPFPKQSLSEESFDDRKTFQYALFSLTSRNSKVTYFIAYRSWWSRKTSNDCFTVVKWHFPYELLWNFRGSCYDNTWWLFGGQPRQCIWIKKESPVQPLFGLVTQRTFPHIDWKTALRDTAKQRVQRMLGNYHTYHKINI